jgi:hypothetical protein
MNGIVTFGARMLLCTYNQTAKNFLAPYMFMRPYELTPINFLCTLLTFYSICIVMLDRHLSLQL